MKFKKNDLVSIDFSAFCSVFNAHNDEVETEPVEYHKVLNCRMTDTGIEYKLRGCYGWWKEDHLKLKPEGSKNSFSHSESSGPTTNTQDETKCDTGDSGEFEALPLEEEKWYRISFSAKLTPDDLRAMKKCFFDAMNESMEIYDLENLEIKEA